RVSDAAGLARIVVHAGVDEQPGGDEEDHAPRRIADASGPADPGRAAGAGLHVLEEAQADGLVELDEAGADQHRAGDVDGELTAGKAERRRGAALRPAAA